MQLRQGQALSRSPGRGTVTALTAGSTEEDSAARGPRPGPQETWADVFRRRDLGSPGASGCCGWAPRQGWASHPRR